MQSPTLLWLFTHLLLRLLRQRQKTHDEEEVEEEVTRSETSFCRRQFPWDWDRLSLPLLPLVSERVSAAQPRNAGHCVINGNNGDSAGSGDTDRDSPATLSLHWSRRLPGKWVIR